MLHQRIVAVGERLDAAAKAHFEILDVIAAPRDHARQALLDGEQIFRACDSSRKVKPRCSLVFTVLSISRCTAATPITEPSGAKMVHASNHAPDRFEHECDVARKVPRDRALPPQHRGR
jgi:hypothetical protein